MARLTLLLPADDAREVLCDQGVVEAWPDWKQFRRLTVTLG